jgi:hypothetical protein
VRGTTGVEITGGIGATGIVGTIGVGATTGVVGMTGVAGTMGNATGVAATGINGVIGEGVTTVGTTAMGIVTGGVTKAGAVTSGIEAMMFVIGRTLGTIPLATSVGSTGLCKANGVATGVMRAGVKEALGNCNSEIGDVYRERRRSGF